MGRRQPCLEQLSCALSIKAAPQSRERERKKGWLSVSKCHSSSSSSLQTMLMWRRTPFNNMLYIVYHGIQHSVVCTLATVSYSTACLAPFFNVLWVRAGDDLLRRTHRNPSIVLLYGGSVLFVQLVAPPLGCSGVFWARHS